MAEQENNETDQELHSRRGIKPAQILVKTDYYKSTLEWKLDIGTDVKKYCSVCKWSTNEEMHMGCPYGHGLLST